MVGKLEMGKFFAQEEIDAIQKYNEKYPDLAARLKNERGYQMDASQLHPPIPSQGRSRGIPPQQPLRSAAGVRMTVSNKEKALRGSDIDDSDDEDEEDEQHSHTNLKRNKETLAQKHVPSESLRQSSTNPKTKQTNR